MLYHPPYRVPLPVGPHTRSPTLTRAWGHRPIPFLPSPPPAPRPQPAVVGGALSGVASTAIAPIVTPFAMDLVEGFAGDGTLADVVGGSLAGGLTLLFVYP